VTLAAENLAIGYPGKPVGRGVTLSVAPGEAVALLGPNGGGKTTLLKTLLGLLAPQGGRVTLDGRPLDGYGIAERARRIGYVPQAHAGTFAFTVRDVVLMGRTAHQGLFASPSVADREVAATSLEALGIGHLAGQAYTMISGGERQLALVARALAQQPRYMLLDEPTASLDFGNQGRVMRQLRTLTDRGLGVLFTTHDPNQAARHAARVALFGGGVLRALGPPADVLDDRALAELYGAPVLQAGEGVFLPG
jgi:iron complex transport system ATP-binding protein